LPPLSKTLVDLAERYDTSTITQRSVAGSASR